MKPLGNGYGLLKIGGKTFIQSVPCILDVDHQAILQVAQVSFKEPKLNDYRITMHM